MRLSHSIAAVIAEIVRAEIEPGLLEIIAIGADLAEREARANAGREVMLRTAESIPMDRRAEVAANFYQTGADEERYIS